MGNSSSKELTHPDEIFYDDHDENYVFNKMRTEGSGLFLGRESEEALTVATSVVEGLSNNS